MDEARGMIHPNANSFSAGSQGSQINDVLPEHDVGQAWGRHSHPHGEQGVMGPKEVENSHAPSMLS